MERDERERERERKREGEREIQYIQIKLQNVKVTIFLGGSSTFYTRALGLIVFFSISPSHQVNGLCVFLGLIAAPRLAPEPFLRQGVDGDRVDHVVREVLVQVSQGVWVLQREERGEKGREKRRTVNRM